MDHIAGKILGAKALQTLRPSLEKPRQARTVQGGGKLETHDDVTILKLATFMSDSDISDKLVLRRCGALSVIASPSASPRLKSGYDKGRLLLSLARQARVSSPQPKVTAIAKS